MLKVFDFNGELPSFAFYIDPDKEEIELALDESASDSLRKDAAERMQVMIINEKLPMTAETVDVMVELVKLRFLHLRTSKRLKRSTQGWEFSG